MDLKEYTFIITRPKQQALQTAKELEGFNSNIIVMPCISILPINNKLDPTDKFDFAIFTSQNAVIHSKHLLPNLIATKYIAVGTKSSEELLLNKIITPKEESSEGILHLPELQDIQNKKIIIIKGQGGRDLLSQELKSRGAVVTELDVYRRYQPVINTAPLLQLSQKQLEKTFVIIGSIETLVNYHSHLPSNAFLNIPLLVKSLRIKNKAKSLKFSKIIVTNFDKISIYESISNDKKDS